jgi:lysozyme
MLEMNDKFTNDDYNKIAKLTKQFEGLRLKAYKCTADKLTVGYGHNCEARPVKGVNKVGDSITLDLANELFDEDFVRCINQVQNGLPWVKKLEAPRQAVLYDMCFNLGLAGLLGFKNTLNMIETNRYIDASNGMLASKWATQVKGRAVKLAEMMKTGKWI